MILYPLPPPPLSSLFSLSLSRWYTFFIRPLSRLVYAKLNFRHTTSSRELCTKRRNGRKCWIFDECFCQRKKARNLLCKQKKSVFLLFLGIPYLEKLTWRGGREAWGKLTCSDCMLKKVTRKCFRFSERFLSLDGKFKDRQCFSREMDEFLECFDEISSWKSNFDSLKLSNLSVFGFKFIYIRIPIEFLLDPHPYSKSLLDPHPYPNFKHRNSHWNSRFQPNPNLKNSFLLGSSSNFQFHFQILSFCKTHLQLLIKTLPNLTNLMVLGYQASKIHVHIPNQHPHPHF